MPRYLRILVALAAVVISPVVALQSLFPVMPHLTGCASGKTMNMSTTSDLRSSA